VDARCRRRVDHRAHVGARDGGVADRQLACPLGHDRRELGGDVPVGDEA
jgi:hypothetical protein